MNDWLKRHVLLTREERLLIAGILLIVLVGLGARFFNENRSGRSDHDTATPPAKSK